MRTSFVSKTFESIQRFGKNDARKQDAAITYPSGRLCNLFFAGTLYTYYRGVL